MKLHTLGTGGPRLDPGRNSSCHVLEIGEQQLMFDVGRGAIQGIGKKGLSISRIGPLFISHLHVDHIGEFANYLITSWIEGRRTPMRVYGPPGTSAIADVLLRSVYDRDIAFRSEGEAAFGPFVGAEVVEVGGGQTIEGGGWRVRCEQVQHGHRLPFAEHFRQRWICLSFRVEAEGKAFSYSGDAVMCDELVRVARGSDLHLQCCYMAASAMRGPHFKAVGQYTLACSDTAGKIAARAEVKRLVLTHFRHSTPDELDEIEADVRRDYAGPVHLSNDLDEYVF